MLTKEEIILLKKDWYTFEQIESIKKWFQDLKKWNIISEDNFWSLVKWDINNFIINKEKCIK